LRKNMHGEISGLQQVLFMRMLTSGLVNWNIILGWMRVVVWQMVKV
jgi:hypothetical protein